MGDVVLAMACFMGAVAAHVFYCRVREKTRLHTKVFVMIALAFLTVYGVSAKKGPEDFLITAGVMYLLLIPCYLCFYVLTQLTSPSKKILTALAGRQQMTYEDILGAVKEERFIQTRMDDLYLCGCVRRENGRLFLSPSGKKIAGVLNFMQVLLSREAGG